MSDKKYKNPDEFIIGGTDDSGNIITKIYSRTPISVVYDIGSPHASESLKTQIIDPSGDGTKNYSLIAKELNSVKSILKKSTSENFHRTSIASAITLAIKGKTDESKEILNDLKTTIEGEYKASNKRRLLYSWTSIIVVFITLTLSFLVYKNKLFDTLKDDLIIQHMIYTITMSSIGGCLSLLIKLDKFNFSNEPDGTVIGYSLERMVLASFAGICAFVLMKANLLLGVLAEQPAIYGFLSAAIIAGFSEKFIPDLINKIEKESAANKA